MVFPLHWNKYPSTRTQHYSAIDNVNLLNKYQFKR